MNIYWDTQNREFVKSLTQGQVVSRIDWFMRDQQYVLLYLTTPSDEDQSYVPYEVPVGWTVKFGCVVDPGDAYLVYEGAWTKHDTETAYEATVNLDTEELIAAVGSAAKLDLIAEFTLQDVEGNTKDTAQINLQIKPDVIFAGALEPTSAESWPWQQEFTDPETGELRVRILNSLGEVRAEF